MSTRGEPEFPDDFDRLLSDESGDVAYFGRDVLRGLVDGIRLELEHQRANASRWHGERLFWALQCGWMIPCSCRRSVDARPCAWSSRSKCAHGSGRRRSNTCDGSRRKLRASLRRHSPELAELARAQGGAPLVVGTGTPAWHEGIPPIRELGFGRVGDRLVPIVHAKLALLGQMRWTDEHPSGHLVDEIYFVPGRLWIGSANFTSSSRRSLEMGMWTSRPSIPAGSHRGVRAIGQPTSAHDPRIPPSGVRRRGVLRVRPRPRHGSGHR